MQGNNDHPAIQNKLYDKISIALNDINIEEVCNIDTFKQIPDLVSIQDVGKIKHIETGIDIFKMFNEDKSDFNIASLAGLNFKKLSYITINIEDNLRGSTELYSGFINTSKLNNLSESDEVEFSIRGKSIFFNITVWIIDEIYPL